MQATYTSRSSSMNFLDPKPGTDGASTKRRMEISPLYKTGDPFSRAEKVISGASISEALFVSSICKYEDKRVKLMKQRATWFGKNTSSVQRGHLPSLVPSLD